MSNIESQLSDLSDLINKVTSLLNDNKVCSSEITKSLIASAVKKYVNAISDFKIELGD